MKKLIVKFCRLKLKEQNELKSRNIKLSEINLYKLNDINTMRDIFGLLFSICS